MAEITPQNIIWKHSGVTPIAVSKAKKQFNKLVAEGNHPNLYLIEVRGANPHVRIENAKREYGYLDYVLGHHEKKSTER